MLNRNVKIALSGTAVAVVLAACAGSMAAGPSDAEARAKALELMKAGFNEKGIAKLDRLNQDETQALCTQYATGNVPKDVAAKIEQANMAAIKPPSDGNYLGDWKRGEQVAQRGTGFQYSDTNDTPVGGNCYACHQLTKEEISHGTIGPSLYNFAKLRGFTPEMQKYAWGKVWNTQAYSACSFMPRFGHAGILSEQQIKDVVALLMDPNSPVNK
jgi:L-cysteine S-thiosulfotransferase